MALDKTMQKFDLIIMPYLTLNDAGFLEVFSSEKWSLSYQIFFQMEIKVFDMKAEMFS
jgi:hypothetical protein